MRTGLYTHFGIFIYPISGMGLLEEIQHFDSREHLQEIWTDRHQRVTLHEGGLFFEGRAKRCGNRPLRSSVNAFRSTCCSTYLPSCFAGDN